MELTILKDIVVIFALSTLVNFLFTKMKIPTIIGYLITGIIVGPSVLRLIHSTHEIELMAEIGVILLMFTIGMEFSLNHLMRIRNVVFIGGFLQLLVTVGIVTLPVYALGISLQTAAFLGFLLALSSTAIVLKILQERGELTSNYGQTVLGVLIFQDIIIIPMMLFVPMLGGQDVDMASTLWVLFLKSLVIIALVYVGNKWLMPKVLQLIAMTKNQELFMMSVMLICLAVALFTSSLGMSLAFGAFLGGLMISESEYSHNAFGNLIPFKDTFTSFFFVSVGILLDVVFVYDNLAVVILAVVAVLVVKAITAGGTAFILGHSFRGTIMVGFALCQVGEFSFILAKIGAEYKIIDQYLYQMFLAVTVITMSVSPFVIKIGKPLATVLLRFPLPTVLVNGLFPLKQNNIYELSNHLVVIGKDPRSLNMAVMARQSSLPCVSIVFDPVLVKKLQQQGESVVYGDATNEPILQKAHVPTADVVVVSIGDFITSMAVVEKTRRLNPNAYIIARSKHVDNVDQLYKLGANQVIPEEFETSINIYERVLKQFSYLDVEIQSTIDEIRENNYGFFKFKPEKKEQPLISDLPSLKIKPLNVSDYPLMHGKTLKKMMFRHRFGVTLVAIKRDNILMEHPETHIRLLPKDTAFFMGTAEQLKKAMEMMGNQSEDDSDL